MSVPGTERLQFREHPILEVTVALAFVAIGMLSLRIAPVVSVLFFIVAGVALLTATIIRITADPGEGKLVVRESSPLRTSVRSYPFGEILAVGVDSERGTRGRPIHAVVMVTTHGERITLLGPSSSEPLIRERAEALRQFLGLPEASGPLASVRDRGETAGVAWRIETLVSPPDEREIVPVTHWIAEEFAAPGGFLCLAQTAGSATGNVSDWLTQVVGEEAIDRFLLTLYRFPERLTPGLATARPVDLHHEGLASSFHAFSSDPEGTHPLLTPAVASLLAGWAARHPIPLVQIGDRDDQGQLVALFSPQGLYLALLGHPPAGQQHEMIELGASLVNELKSPAA